jgi:carbamoyl-phosphate synthase large subunit
MKVLISSAGRRNYIVEYFQQTLGNKDNVIVVNSIENTSAMFTASVRFIAPPVSSDEYIPFLLNICKSNNIKLFLSLFDQDLMKISRHKQDFFDNDIIPAVSDSRVIETTFDKVKFSEFLNDIDLLSPKIYKNDESFPTKIKSNSELFPLFLKPRWGTGSIATEIVNNKDDFSAFLDYLNRKLQNSYINNITCLSLSNEILIQQFIPGDEYNLDVINDLNGNYVTTFAKRKYAMRSGETDVAETVADPDLIEIGKKLGKELKHVGLLDVDIIKSPGGEYFIIDANPRFGGGYPFSHAAGANIPACYLNWAIKKLPEPEWLTIKPKVISVKGIKILSRCL